MPPKKGAPSAPAPKKTVVAKSVAKPAAAKAAPATGQKKAAGKKPDATQRAVPAAAGSRAGEPAPAAKSWTREDEAARRIQTCARGFLARRALAALRNDKAAYEETMERLEREAYIKIAKMQQEEAEKERQREEEERKRKAEERRRIKRTLDAAFEGDNGEILLCLKEVADLDDKNSVGHDVIGEAIRAKHLLNMADCEDAHGNTPLSEAASGGHPHTIRLLIEKGADVNSRGQFQRTPLYRAAFAGHLDCVQELLKNGADPRMRADDGQAPADVASVEAVRITLDSWDIQLTENLLQMIEQEKDKRKEREKRRHEAEQTRLEEQIAEAQKEFDASQKLLHKLYGELNKRILEHDLAISEGFDKPELTVQVIQDAEGEVEIAKMNFEKIQGKLANLKMKLREQQHQSADPGSLPGLNVRVRELSDVLLRDVGNRIADSGRWPLLIDPSAQAATFLRYQDTNYLNALNTSQMEANKVRQALVGAIRYGKPLVLDMMEVDMIDAIETRMDQILPGLFSSLIDKSILQEEMYLKLVRESDGEEYEKKKFQKRLVNNFKLFIITKNSYPSDKLMERTYPIRVNVPLDQ